MRYLSVLLLLLLSCEPMSGTDRERARREMRAELAERAKWGENQRRMREYRREFASRFQGQVQPGVGCNVCASLCKLADLRQVPAPELHRMYRDAAREHGYPVDDRMLQLAYMELRRLACIARDGGPAMHEAWLPLLDASEDPAVRYAAAMQAIQHEFAPDAGFHVLAEIATGSSKFVIDARIALDEATIGIVPSL